MIKGSEESSVSRDGFKAPLAGESSERRYDYFTSFRYADLIINRFIEEVSKDQVILDIGSQYGVLAGEMRRRNLAPRYVGLDVDAVAVAIARKYFSGPDMRFVLEDFWIATPDCLGLFDLVICSLSSTLIGNLKEVVFRAMRFVNDSGKCVIIDMIRTSGGEPHSSPGSLNYFVRELQASYTLEEVYAAANHMRSFGYDINLEFMLDNGSELRDFHGNKSTDNSCLVFSLTVS